MAEPQPAYRYYTERLQVGYRFYDAQQIKPAFAFGHGLSYTTFGYDGLAINTSMPISNDLRSSKPVVLVSFDLRNTGRRGGVEVAQLYLRFPRAATEPPKVLRGFKRVWLAQSARHAITFHLLPKDLAIWEPGAGWSMVGGEFEALVGSSSRDIRLAQTFQIPKRHLVRSTNAGGRQAGEEPARLPRACCQQC